MRSALAAAAALVVLGCRQQQAPVPPPSEPEWSQASPDGRLAIRQRREGTGCRVQAVVSSRDGERSLWSTQTCLPVPSGLVFLSPNGERVLVLDLFPSSPAAGGSDWSRLPLMAVWARGAVVRQYAGAEILGDRAANMSKVLSWVKGDTFDDAHRAAHPSADGDTVEITLVDGRTLTVGFAGGALPAPAAPAPSAAAPAADEPAQPAPLPVRAADVQPSRADRAALLAADEVGLYSWEDDQGGLHFGAGSQIPPRYRSRARPVDATVGVIPTEKVKTTPPATPAAQPGPAQPGAAQPGTAQPAPAVANGGPAPAGGAQPTPAPAGAQDGGAIVSTPPPPPPREPRPPGALN